VALIEGRSAGAVALFKKAKNVRDDADARLLIGKQMAAANELDGAMAEYEAALKNPKIEPSTKSELHRCTAQVYMNRGARGKAREELKFAQDVDDEHRNYAGLAQTHRLIGELFEPRADRKNAALTAYNLAAENYERADMLPEAEVVRRKLSRLKGDGVKTRDAWWARLLVRWAQFLLRRVERHRVRVQRREE
jgi:tetratricopeptide (TPR) repeat protein